VDIQINALINKEYTNKVDINSFGPI